MLGAQIGQQNSLEGSVRHATDMARVGTDLPRFAKRSLGRQALAKKCLQSPIPPNLGPEIGFENKRFHGGILRRGGMGGERRAVRPTCGEATPIPPVGLKARRSPLFSPAAPRAGSPLQVPAPCS